MDAIVLMLFLAVSAGLWWWLAKRMKQGGRGWFLRHFAGSTAGLFAGLVVVSLTIELGIIEATTKPGEAGVVAPSASRPPVQKAAPIPYSITQDLYREGRPRKVEVTLPRRLSDAELAEVAAAVRDDTNVSAARTFIGFRVEGQTATTYWANASFDPDYQSTLIGSSAEDYQKLLAIDLSSYPESIGSWLRDGALGHVMVLYTRDGKHYIDQIFPSGGKNTEAYMAKPLADGDLRLEEPENDFGEFYVLKKDGSLQGWGENGMYLALPSRKPTL